MRFTKKEIIVESITFCLLMLFVGIIAICLSCYPLDLSVKSIVMIFIGYCITVIILSIIIGKSEIKKQGVYND